MSAPPPPPPPNMAPPPPALFSSKGGGSDERSALLKSIQKGAKLRKAVTNDKSAPMIGNKTSNNSTGNANSFSGEGGSPAASAPNGLNLGDIFASGMPKLKPTGKFVTSASNSNDNPSNIRKKPEVPPPPIKDLSSVQNELRKQMASDSKNRGPPPPAPIRNVPEESNILKHTKNATINGFRINQSSLHSISNIQDQSHTLNRKTKSNANLSSLDHTDSSLSEISLPAKPVINYGKPNLAPKPPTLNGKPIAPPKKLIMNGKAISRAHSLKSPRLPSPKSPDAANTPIKFGTVRNLSSVIGQSLGHSTGNLSSRPRPVLNGRPTAPPPSIPSQQLQLTLCSAPPPASQAPPPPSKTGAVKPPNHAPPPPPGGLPLAPSHAPPLPPHRTQPSRAPPAVPGNLNAPPPPPRHSSMRENNTTVRKIIGDWDEKFKHMFHNSSMFPKPPPYRNVLKLYSHRQAGSKQQAPQPPNLLTTSNTWDAATTC